MAQRPASIDDKTEPDDKNSCDLLSDILTDLNIPPPPEEQLGGGDICSLEEEPSTEDDKPLD